jgi:hypothetical protein
VDLRLDRVGLLLDQLEATCEYSRARLEGLTDEEYLWEPAPGLVGPPPGAGDDQPGLRGGGVGA